MIYFAQAGSDGPVKIGQTKNVAARIRVLQTGQAGRLVVLRTIDAEEWVERWFHAQFASLRLYGEWFIYSADMLCLKPPKCRPEAMVRLHVELPVSLAQMVRRVSRRHRQGVNHSLQRAVRLLFLAEDGEMVIQTKDGNRNRISI